MAGGKGPEVEEGPPAQSRGVYDAGICHRILHTLRQYGIHTRPKKYDAYGNIFLKNQGDQRSHHHARTTIFPPEGMPEP